MVTRLEEYGVMAVNFWRMHHPLGPKHPSHEVIKLRRNVLALPCHQDLTPEAVDRIADCVCTVMREAR
jgi:dTDP-4-amino-4,6-dideoxygalactose transaminase